MQKTPGVSLPTAYAESCERNREPILQALRQAFSKPGLVLELGSGTGQHAVYFAPSLPHLTWQPTELESKLAGIQEWRDAFGPTNVLAPCALDISRRPWPVTGWTHVFSANTAHIVPWTTLESMFAGIGADLPEDGVFCLYGPFHEHGAPTSDANRHFDTLLRAQDPNSGIRDRDALITLAQRNGLRWRESIAMPANNQILVWERAQDGRDTRPDGRDPLK